VTLACVTLVATNDRARTPCVYAPYTDRVDSIPAQSANERLYNKARKSEITTRMKKVFVNAQALMAADACTDSDISGLEKLIAEATKAVDKAVARGTLHKNTGARRKARMSKFKMDVRVAKGLYTA
jgi:small subunit ribosomal protein S20